MTQDIIDNNINIKATYLKDLDLIDNNNQQMCKEIFKFFSTVPQGMTGYQIKNFVLGNIEYPTYDSKYWQAKLELFVRLQGVISLHYEYRRKLAKIKWYNAKIKECGYNIKNAKQTHEIDINLANIEKYRIDIEEAEFTLLNIKKTVSDKVKEMTVFWKYMEELKLLIKYSTEDKEEQEEDFWWAKSINTPELVKRYPEVFS